MIERLHQHLRQRLAPFGLSSHDLLYRDAPGGLNVPGLASANRKCRVLKARDGWVALNLARPEDLDLVTALTASNGDHWAALEEAVSGQTVAAFRDSAIELQLPVAVLCESEPQPLAEQGAMRVPRKVIDLSALWAGPLCAGLLARVGAQVVRIESLGRPDPTPHSSPRLDSLINSGKTRLTLDLRNESDLAHLHNYLDQADAAVTSARPAALARLGLTPARFPHLVWVAISAHGFTGPAAHRVGFGDDCAAAGNLMRWERNAPHFLGDALADPLTGLEAALAVLEGRQGLLDMAMARIAAAWAAILA